MSLSDPLALPEFKLASTAVIDLNTVKATNILLGDQQITSLDEWDKVSVLPLSKMCTFVYTA